MLWAPMLSGIGALRVLRAFVVNQFGDWWGGRDGAIKTGEGYRRGKVTPRCPWYFPALSA